MKFATSILVGIFVTGSAAAGASTLFGSKGEFRTFLSRLEYNPDKSCSKPMRPYSEDSFAREQYIQNAKLHLQCMEDAASADVGYANEVIAEGLQKAQDDFIQEVKRGY